MKFIVEWRIDIDADNAREAAAKALEIQRDPASLATCFTVFDEAGDTFAVDLLEEPAA